MTRGLERWYGGHDLHFITCSCYRPPKQSSRSPAPAPHGRQQSFPADFLQTFKRYAFSLSTWPTATATLSLRPRLRDRHSRHDRRGPESPLPQMPTPARDRWNAALLQIVRKRGCASWQENLVDRPQLPAPPRPTLHLYENRASRRKMRDLVIQQIGEDAMQERGVRFDKNGLQFRDDFVSVLRHGRPIQIHQSLHYPGSSTCSFRNGTLPRRPRPRPA